MHCAHSSDFARDRKFDSSVSYFSILIKACSYLFAHTSLGFFCPFILVGDEWEDEYTLFGLKSFEVHPTNSQYVSLPMIGFEYANDLPLIHKGPLRRLVGIMAHLVVGHLLIHPFSSKEPTHT